MAKGNVSEHGANAAHTPFLDHYADEAAVSQGNGVLAFRETPFLSEYPESEEEAGDPMAELLDELLEELHDRELDEAVLGLAEELRGMVASEPAYETEQEDAREAMLQETVAPLLRAAQADIGRVAEAIGKLDLGVAGEDEIHAAVDGTPREPLANPAFEFFLDGLRKKLKKIASSAVKLAKKGLSPALGFILKPLIAKLQALAKPLIDKVVAFALDKVPEPYKPMVAALAARLRGRVESAAASASAQVTGAATEPGAPPVPQQPAIPDTAQAQHELDVALAELALGGDRIQSEAIGSGSSDERLVARDPYAELARARARFVREITEAESAEEAEVVVEHFLPAVMFALGQAIRLAGRDRVLGWLSRPIAALIAPLIGKANAPVLGKVLADVGLRTFLHAEVDSEAEREALGETLAATVEETVRRVAQSPADGSETQETLAASAHEAFEAAAAANFPASLVRPELRETERPGAWVLLPAHRRHRFKKFSHVFDVAVTPAVARAVRGYGSSTVAGLFRDRLRLSPAATVNARLHLYEAVPGTSLAAIARTEEARGLGSSELAVSSQLLPLTPEASLLLLGSPGLGRELSEDAQPGVPSIGQRLYFLEVAGAPARPLGQESHVKVSVHLREGQIRLSLYLSEVVAQKVATALRAKKPAAAVVAELRALVAPAVGAFGHHRSHGLVHVQGGRHHLHHQHAHGAAGHGARHALRRQLASLALHWAWKHLTANLDQVAAELIAKTEGPEDGVRLVFSFHVPGGLAGIARAFRGHGHVVADWPPSAPSRTTLSIHAGPKHA
jgi:hypothetical protein